MTLVDDLTVLLKLGLLVFVLLWSHSKTAQADNKPRIKKDADQLLTLSIEELMQVEVTSVSRRAQKLSETPSAIFVITQDDIRRSGVTSIPEVLRMAPGVDVARVGTDKWSISIRGFNGRFANKLQVLIDGRSVYTPLFSGVIWSQQDTLLEDVERIEVIRGPGATVWGVNAVNGVINIITKKAADTQGLLFTAGGGSFEQGFVGARYGGMLGENTPFRIYTKAFSRDHSHTLSGTSTHDSWQSVRTGFRIDHTQGIDQLTLQGDIFANRIGDSLMQPSLIAPFSRLDVVDTTEKGGNIRLRWDRTFSEKSSIMLQTYYDRVHNQLAPWTKYAESFDVDFQHRLPLLQRHDVTWGLNYRLYNNKVTETMLTAFTPAQRTNHNFSAFIRDDIMLLPDKLVLSLGTRLDHNDFTGLEVQPNGRLMFTPDPQNSMWLSISRAVRIPSRGENDVTIAGRVVPGLPGMPAFPVPVLMAVQGNHHYQAEKLIAYELGYRRRITENASVDLAGFFNDYSQLRDFRFGPMVPGTGPIPYLVLPVVFSNDTTAHSYGFESSVDWRPRDNWRLQGSYSFLHINTASNPEFRQLDSSSAGAHKANPSHQLSVRSHYDFSEKLQLNLWLRYVSGLAFFNIPGYVTMDTKLTWKPIKNAEVFVVGQNLFSQYHRESQSDFIPSLATFVQRGVYAGVEWRY
ncbi:TonB-dependent receptor plug domain-containing protein [Nitrosomonas sp.]|uniref:TonB-dependent receptor plug domain-containing protein n=1 Tax=Nitrosomonas sp. TaxID=42353 RepID=UPI001D40F801|nr:TonB-dependent receptor [Nitrosomonas sp.]MBX3615881.1 TonB-dependent receptor [Nitrosomonas sp.]